MKPLSIFHFSGDWEAGGLTVTDLLVVVLVGEALMRSDEDMARLLDSFSTIARNGR